MMHRLVLGWFHVGEMITAVSYAVPDLILNFTDL